MIICQANNYYHFEAKILYNVHWNPKKSMTSPLLYSDFLKFLHISGSPTRYKYLAHANLANPSKNDIQVKVLIITKELYTISDEELLRANEGISFF